MWWLTNTVPGLEKWRQDDSEFKATGICYIVISKPAWQHESLQAGKRPFLAPKSDNLILAPRTKGRREKLTLETSPLTSIGGRAIGTHVHTVSLKKKKKKQNNKEEVCFSVLYLMFTYHQFVIGCVEDKGHWDSRWNG